VLHKYTAVNNSEKAQILRMQRVKLLGPKLNPTSEEEKGKKKRIVTAKVTAQ